MEQSAKDLALKLVQDGMSYRQVASRLKCSKSQIGNIVDEAKHNERGSILDDEDEGIDGIKNGQPGGERWLVVLGIFVLLAFFAYLIYLCYISGQLKF